MPSDQSPPSEHDQLAWFAEEYPKLQARLGAAEAALNQAHNDLRDIAEASPNWMEKDAVAESERRKSAMARNAMERAWAYFDGLTRSGDA